MRNLFFSVVITYGLLLSFAPNNQSENPADKAQVEAVVTTAALVPSSDSEEGWVCSLTGWYCDSGGDEEDKEGGDKGDDDSIAPDQFGHNNK